MIQSLKIDVFSFYKFLIFDKNLHVFFLFSEFLKERKEKFGKQKTKAKKNVGDSEISQAEEIRMKEIQIDENASKEHYTLCRCGASNNKPFCDGAHNTINFKDEKN